MSPAWLKQACLSRGMMEVSSSALKTLHDSRQLHSACFPDLTKSVGKYARAAILIYTGREQGPAE